MRLPERAVLRILAIPVAALLALPAAAPAGEPAGAVRLGGTGSALAAMGEMGRAFEKEHPGANVIVVANLGSSGGIKAVINGAIDIGLSGRLPRGDETGNSLSVREYARTPFVFATSRKAPGVDFTLQDLARIYSGETTEWPDGVPLRLILRPRGDSDTAVLKDMSPGMAEAVETAHGRRGMLLAVTDQECASLMEKIRGSLGTSTLALIVAEKRALHPLRVDGAEPTVEALAEGSYPYYKSLYLVTGKEMSPGARAFYEFVFSGRGREILERTGHLARR